MTGLLRYAIFTFDSFYENIQSGVLLILFHLHGFTLQVIYEHITNESWWAEQVHYKFELREETLFLTVNLIDRFLERHEVARKNLQLVGVTSMLLACKYEEVFVPSVDEFVMITDKAYTKKEVLNMVPIYSSPFDGMHPLYCTFVLNIFNSPKYLSLILNFFLGTLRRKLW